jgi:hypothetical protein
MPQCPHPAQQLKKKKDWGWGEGEHPRGTTQVVEHLSSNPNTAKKKKKNIVVWKKTVLDLATTSHIRINSKWTGDQNKL